MKGMIFATTQWYDRRYSDAMYAMLSVTILSFDVFTGSWNNPRFSILVPKVTSRPGIFSDSSSGFVLLDANKAG